MLLSNALTCGSSRPNWGIIAQSAAGPAEPRYSAVRHGASSTHMTWKSEGAYEKRASPYPLGKTKIPSAGDWNSFCSPAIWTRKLIDPLVIRQTCALFHPHVISCLTTSAE